MYIIGTNINIYMSYTLCNIATSNFLCKKFYKCFKLNTEDKAVWKIYHSGDYLILTVFFWKVVFVDVNNVYHVFNRKKNNYHANACKNMIVQLLDLMLAYNEHW